MMQGKAQLTPVQVRIVLLYRDGLTTAAIARIVGCSPGAVRHQICRARRATGLRHLRDLAALVEEWNEFVPSPLR